MAVSVRLNDGFVKDAAVRAEAANRSIPKQIEYMAMVGQISIDNPDLSYEFINESLLAKAEMEKGVMTKYERRTKRK